MYILFVISENIFFALKIDTIIYFSRTIIYQLYVVNPLSIVENEFTFVGIFIRLYNMALAWQASLLYNNIK